MKLKRSLKNLTAAREEETWMSPGMRPDTAVPWARSYIYVCVLCIMIYCEENTHDVPSPASAATDPASRVCDNLYWYFPNLKEVFLFFFLFFEQDYMIVITILYDDDDGDSPPATPSRFLSPFSVYCRLLLLLLSRRFLLLIEWLSGFHFSFWPLYKANPGASQVDVNLCVWSSSTTATYSVIFIKRQQLSLSLRFHLYLFILNRRPGSVCVILTHLVRR